MDESLQDRFDRALDGDTSETPGESDDAKESNGEERELTRREKRQLERIERTLKEEEEFRNINEYWYKDPNIQVKVHKPDGEYEVLETALLENRVTLETLKRAYCRSRRRQHKTITDAYFHEIKRYVNAIESIKDILATRAEDYRVYYTDREHPLVACKRIILDCFIATTLYGPEAHQTNVLRLFWDVRLAPSRTGRRFIRLYYEHLGPWASHQLKRSLRLRKGTRFIMDWLIARIERSL